MKICEAIAKIDAIKFNDFGPEEKIAWLSKLDATVKKEIIDTHEGAENIKFNGYDENTSLDTQLLVPAPHDTMYIRWLEAQIDYQNGDITRYSNSMAMFNSEYSAYSRWYNRTHMPLGKSFKYF